MHVNVIDHQAPCTIKFMSAPVPGLETDTELCIRELISHLESRGHKCDIYGTDKTIESVKRKYAKLTKFYYPNSLYLKVTVRPYKSTYATLTLNVDNIHVLDFYTPSASTIDDYETIVDVIINTKKKYRYLL